MEVAQATLMERPYPRNLPPPCVLALMLEEGRDAWVSQLLDVPVHAVRKFRSILSVPSRPPEAGQRQKEERGQFLTRWRAILEPFWDGWTWTWRQPPEGPDFETVFVQHYVSVKAGD